MALTPPASPKEKCKALKKACGKKIYPISAVSGDGVKDVLRAMLAVIETRRSIEAQPAGEHAGIEEE